MTNLVTALNCSDSVFNHIYDGLYSRAASENEALYQTELRKAKTQAAKKKVSGCFCGNWQLLLNAYCAGKIANIHCIEAISLNFISAELESQII